MGQWTNPNVTQVTSLASMGSITGTPAQNMAPGPSTYQPVVLQNVSSFASYDMNMYGYALSPGIAGAAIVIPVQLQWYDDLVSGIPVFEEDWYIWAGRAAPTGPTSYMAASGPMHGIYLTVTITNIAVPGMVIQYFNLFGSNRVVPYSDWRQNATQVNPASNGLVSLVTTSASTSGDAFDNVLLGLDTVAVGAAGTVWAPLGLYAGPCYYRINVGSSSETNITLCSTEGIESGTLIAGNGGFGILVSVPGVATTEYEGTFIAGRAPVALVFRGNAAASSISCRITAQQAA